MARLVLRFALVLLIVAEPVHAASQMDILIQRLVDKGLFTAAEAEALVAELAEVKAVPTEHLTPPPPLAASPPAVSVSDASVSAASNTSYWADRIDIKGDLRGRYQTERLDNAPTEGPIDIVEQDRARIRWRLGGDAQVAERWTVGFGLASGGSDPRSTNQTLNGAFSRGDARLDYAYARYAPNEHLETLVGKFENPLWRPKDQLWDADIRPDGVAARYTFAVGDHVNAFVTPAYLVLTESVSNSRDEASMWLLQAGATFALGERASLTIAPTYYAFDHLEGTPGPLALSVPSNSRDDGGNLLYDYDALAAGANLVINDVGPLSHVSLFGEYVNAFDANDDNTGYLLGFSLGEAKVADFGDWQFVYSHHRLERDAWPEFLSDSEALFGATNARGNEFEFLWGLGRNVWLVADYYANFEYIGTDIEQDLFHVDLNLKW